MIRRSGSVQWIAGTAVACVMALVASWLLLLGPMLDDAAAKREQAAGVRAGNEALQASVDALRDDFARIADYRAELAALQLQLPSEARLSELTREIASAAAAAGVTVVGLDVSASVGTSAGGAAAPAPDAATAATGAVEAPDPAATAADPAASAAAQPGAGMVAIPLTVKVVGPVEPVRAFLTSLQTGLQRQLLVATLGLRALEESDGDESRPASRIGDVEATIGTYAYVLPSDVAAAGDAGTALDGTLPAPSGASPFAPSAQAPAPAAPDPAQSMADAVTSAIAEASAQGQAQAQAAADAAAAASAAHAAAEAQIAAAAAQVAAAEAQAAAQAGGQAPQGD